MKITSRLPILRGYYERNTAAPDLLHRAIQVQALPVSLRDYFRRQLEN